jgi:hypothetical protein
LQLREKIRRQKCQNFAKNSKTRAQEKVFLAKLELSGQAERTIGRDKFMREGGFCAISLLRLSMLKVSVAYDRKCTRERHFPGQYQSDIVGIRP